MDDAFQRMYDSLNHTFSERLPNGLTDSARQRLKKTLGHYTNEIIRIHGNIQEQDILRETYDSVVKWFHRHTSQLTQEDTFSNTQEKSSPVKYISTPIDALDTTEENPVALARAQTIPHSVPAFEYPHLADSLTKKSFIPPEFDPILAKPSVLNLPVQQKDFIQRQDDVMKYRETEYNLIISSKDRDWVHGTKENRYNFTVQLDSGARPQGSGIQATLMNRFKNIVRIEFIKAIFPVEGLEVVIPLDETKKQIPDQAFVSTLALPYVQVMMDEVLGNNYGTNDTIDKSLAVCQYDATWRTDTASATTTSSRGYTLFFPKFMKAQRVYSPTPLANLQKMTFQILNPENQVLAKTPDAIGVKQILFGQEVTTSIYADPSSEYVFFLSKEWFPIWAFSQLDRILLGGLGFASSNSTIQNTGTEAIDWFQRPEGHIVVGIGYTEDSTVVEDGVNSCGYANCIIMRNRFSNPSTGVCERSFFGSSISNESDLAVALTSQITGGALLNSSRQVQLVMRIITRDVDSASKVRADNV
jgi:hypothetical protein